MKIAIIGAGVCGLYLAWKLAERGEKVFVFEKRGVVGKEACSGLFSERILGFVPESEKLIENKIDYCLLHFPRKTVKIKFSKRFLVMSHYSLDNLVADLAERAGAKIIKEQSLTHQDLTRMEKEYDRIIGTDGANSFVRRSLGEPEPNFRLGIQGFTKNTDSSPFVEAWSTKNGFLWKIPRGAELADSSAISSPRAPQKRASVTEWGIIEEPVGARRILDNFLQRQGVVISNIKSTLVPQGLIIPKNPKITLCGDASGLTKPWSGGGVVWNLIAASLLLKNFPDFIKYRRKAKKFFLSKIAFSKIVTKTVYFLGHRAPYFLPRNCKIESDFLI